MSPMSPYPENPNVSNVSKNVSKNVSNTKGQKTMALSTIAIWLGVMFIVWMGSE